ncbi:hypothetical protein [Amylibacter sp. IMCC11727]|uniref:hypothetical protein n=1 Tax=Amylibacter sp. IMCC11727 TaxID=3039851 RepID=UPI00244DEB43|nr:hypothetical protein [Amylibacter sp. IMCC11727]WGI21777.1 hypothetical protein QBD29_16960 [Amylibacter sp. IMCC11727]
MKKGLSEGAFHRIISVDVSKITVLGGFEPDKAMLWWVFVKVFDKVMFEKEIRRMVGFL